jgi:hypothetical protein
MCRQVTIMCECLPDSRKVPGLNSCRGVKMARRSEQLRRVLILMPVSAKSRVTAARAYSSPAREFCCEDDSGYEMERPPHLPQLPGHPTVATAHSKLRSSSIKSGPGLWIPPGQDIEIQGLTIPGRMLYVGEQLSSVTRPKPEPALISRKLAVDFDPSPLYVYGWAYAPSYQQKSAKNRGLYLRWLARRPRTRRSAELPDALLLWNRAACLSRFA